MSSAEHNNVDSDALEMAKHAVLGPSLMSENAIKIEGYDFNEKFDFKRLMDSYLTTGFQSTHLAIAINVRILGDLITY